MKRKQIKKIIAFGLSAVFISQQTLFAQQDFSARQPASPEFSVASRQFEDQIPAEIGTIVDQFGNNPAVILIQDAHGHNEAQTNTVRILEWLDTFEKTEALFIEGGFGELEASRLRFSGNSSGDLAFARTLMNQSDIGGAEYFLLEQLTGHQKTIPAYGLENPALYFENLKAYQITTDAESKTEKKLEFEWAQLQHHASRHLNPELSAFYKSWLGYAKSEDFSRAFPVLTEAARRHLKLSFQDARSQIQWPMMTRLSELKKRGKKTDPHKAGEDRQRLVRWLEQLKGNDSSYLQVLKQEEFLRAPRFEEGDFSFASRREFWEKFYSDMSLEGFAFEKYPHLTFWEGARILESELEIDVLQKEMSSLESMVFDRLIKTPEEKSLIQKAQRLLLTGKLATLKLTRPEFEVLAQNHELRKDALFRNAFNFYGRALLRDRVMAEKIETTMKHKKIQKAAVIVGGFHTGGLTSRLKQKNISYAVIRPHLSEIGSGQDYRDVVMGKLPAMPLNLSTLRAFSWLNAPRYFSRLPDANYRRYIRLTKSFYGSRSELRVTFERLREIDRAREKRTLGMLEDVLEGLASRSSQIREYADELTEKIYRSKPQLFSKKNLLFAMDVLETDPDKGVKELVLKNLFYFSREIDLPKLEKILRLKIERGAIVQFLARLLKMKPALAGKAVYDFIMQNSPGMGMDEINLLGQLIQIKPEYGDEQSLKIVLSFFGSSSNLQGLKSAVEWFDRAPKAFTVENYQLFRKSFSALNREVLPVYYRFAKANPDEVLKDENMIPNFILPLLWDDTIEDNQRMAAEILVIFLEKNPSLKKYAGPRVKKILARYKGDIQMNRLIDTVNMGGKTGLDTKGVGFNAEGGFQNRKRRPRSEVRTEKQLQTAKSHSEQWIALPNVDEELPARLFLNTLRIKQAERIEEEKGPEEGSRIVRIRIPEPRPEKILPRGLEVLEHELAPTRDFELLFNKEGNIIAIFPLLKPALRNKRVLNYFDISHLYFSPPAIEPKSDPVESVRLWDEFWTGFEADERLLEKYKESRNIHTSALAQKKKENLYHVSRTDWDAGGFYFLAMDLKTGKVLIRPLWKDDFQRRKKALKLLLRYEEGIAKTIIPRFPTVYYPKLGNDRDYANGIFDYVKGLNLSPGDPLFVGGVGSGSDSWFLFQALKALGKEDVEVYGFDVNAVALANAAATVQGSGFTYKALKIHDNLVARNGKPAFPGIIFKGGIWNTPEEEGEIDPEFESFLNSRRRMAEWWDGHPVLGRLARGLRARLAPETPTHLWAKRVGYGFGGVKNIMAKGGLQVTQIGNYAYRVFRTSDVQKEKLRSEVRQNDSSPEDEYQQHHFRVESMIEFHPKDFLLFAENPEKRGTPDPMVSRYYSRPAETGPPNIFVPGKNPQHDRRVLLVRKAVEWMKKRSTELNDPAINERAQRIGRETTVISVSAPTRLFVYNARDARIGVYHISRRRSAIHFPVLFLDSLDPADESHVEELALYLDRAQRWIDAYEAAEKNVRQNKIKLEDVPEIMELDRVRFEEQDRRMLGDDGKLGLILERLKKLADRDHHDEPERVMEIRIFHETVSEIEKTLERKSNPTRDDFHELATYYGRLAHLQENAGSHAAAVLSYRKQVKALHQLQVYDTGQLPLKIQKDIIRILLRAGLDDEFLKELKVFFTGNGFPARFDNPVGLWRSERDLLADEIEHYDTAFATELISVLWEKKSLVKNNYRSAKALETEVLRLHSKSLIDISSKQWDTDSLNFPAYPHEAPRSEVRSRSMYAQEKSSRPEFRHQRNDVDGKSDSVSLQDYRYDKNLGKDSRVAVVVKATNQLERNQSFLQRRLGNKFDGSTNRRGPLHGLVTLVSLTEDSIQSVPDESSLYLDDPNGFDIHGDKIVIASWDKVIFHNIKTQKTRVLRNPWFAHLHSAVFSKDGNRVLVVSSGFDTILELDAETGKVTWEWPAWEHGYPETFSGNIFYSRETIDPIQYAGNGFPTGLRTANINGAHYDSEGRILATLLYRGELIRIDRMTGNAEKLATFGTPHAFTQIGPSNYAVTSTSGADPNFSILNSKFEPVQKVTPFGLPGTRENFPVNKNMEWIQGTDQLGKSLYAMIDMHRSALFLIDMKEKSYRKISLPKEWSVQNVVAVNKYVNLPSQTLFAAERDAEAVRVSRSAGREPRSEARMVKAQTTVAKDMTARIVARGMEWMVPVLFAAEEINSVSPEIEKKEIAALAELLKGNANAILPADLLLGARASIRDRFIELLARAVNGTEKQKIIFSGPQAPELLEVFSAKDIFKTTPRLHQVIQTNAADENVLAARMKNETVSASFEDLDETSNLSLIPAFRISTAEFERLNPADQLHYLIHLTQLQLLAAEVLKDQLNDRATLRAQVLREFLTKAGIQFSDENGFLKPSARSLVIADLTKLVQAYQRTSSSA